MDFVYNVRNSSSGGGSGTVTSVGTTFPLTGGPITTTGSVAISNFPDGDLLANISGGNAIPIPNTLTAILDHVLGNSQGNLIYRNATNWTSLAPSTAGFLLQTGGISGNPSWTPAGVLPFNGFLIYVSQAFGNDANSGSFTNPLATIGAAIILAGAPPSSAPVIIVILDGNTYTEHFAINNPNVYISAPFSQIIWTGSEDTVTINASSSGTLITAASIANTGGGNAIVNNMNETILLSSLILSQGNILNNSTGALIIEADLIVVDINNPGGGNVFYDAAIRVGFDDVGVFGINATGSTAPQFTVKRFIASGLNYPTVDGGPGQVLATDGATNLSFINAVLTMPNALQEITNFALQVDNGLIAGTAGGIAGTVTVQATTQGSVTFQAQDQGAANANILTVQTPQTAFLGVPITYIIPAIYNPVFGYNVTLMPSKQANNDPASNMASVSVLITFSELATSNINLIIATPGAQYRLWNIRMNGGGTNFSGGDRNVQVNCFGNIYSTIPAAALMTLVNCQWGDSTGNVPYPVPGFPINTPTPAGFNLAIEYSGGTTNYTAGQFVIDILYERVV